MTDGRFGHFTIVCELIVKGMGRWSTIKSTGWGKCHAHLKDNVDQRWLIESYQRIIFHSI
jgi:hypothetical protein